MNDKPFDPKIYWEERLAAHTDLKGTGHHRFDLDYNAWLYRTQEECLDELISRWKIPIAGSRVLDIGSGTGFFIDYFQNRRAGAITGLDITKASKEYLEKYFPEHAFYVANISDQSLPVKGYFDVISAMGILYHIIEDALFERALSNICELLAPGGYLLVTDSFGNSRVPSARHARLRPFESYNSILLEKKLLILEILPLFYYSNRPYIPWIGPWILNTFKVGRILHDLDRKLRRQDKSNGNGLKVLLARMEPSNG